MKRVLFSALLSVAAVSSQASSFTVDAMTNSSSGGAGLNTISLAGGEAFSVSVDAGDLWNAGALPRWSNANGLTGNLYATGSDDSGNVAGTLIGVAFPTWTQDGYTAAYGALVGKIGSQYFT